MCLIRAINDNAGIHAFSPRTTVDGYDEMMAVNYLAPSVLTSALRETLIRTAAPRIVTTASEASGHHGKIKLTGDMFAPTQFSRLGS